MRFEDPFKNKNNKQKKFYIWKSEDLISRKIQGKNIL